MSKAPEEMAEEYCNTKQLSYVERLVITKGFIDGYKAAMDQVEAYKDAAKGFAKKLRELTPVTNQLADADKVMCNTTMEEVKAVDTGELMPITNLPTPAKWISVKDRLPEDFEDVLTFEDGECYRVNSISQLTKYWWDSDEGFERHPTHWMPLPEPPKEEK